MNTEPKVGDWISFYRDGHITIAEVRYIRDVVGYSGRKELCTGSGAVDSGSVLEIRSGCAP